MPPRNDKLLDNLANKRRAQCAYKPSGFVMRNKSGQIVAKTDENGKYSNRGGYQEIRHFQTRKTRRSRDPFRSEFLAYVKTGGNDANALRESLQITVECNEFGPSIPAPLTSWNQLRLPSSVRQHLLTSGFKAPTPIQAQLVPALLTGQNCLGIAQTGSGKTLAYLLPLLIHVLAQPCEVCRNPIGLVLSPTRELALQIDQVLRPLAKCVGLSVVRVIGGLDKQAMEKASSLGAHICIATPNCFLDIAVVDGVTLSCHRVTMVVLDEVDRMLAMGFEEQVRAILGAIRPDRHVALLSATCSPAVQRLLQKIVNQYIKVAVNETEGLTMNASIKQHFYSLTDKAQRIPKLLTILEGKSPGTVIVFVSTFRVASQLSGALTRKGIPSVALHGKMPQAERLTSMAQFDDGTAHVLVATELAARGLDLRQVRCVINYDMPSKARDYVHRIGRTGRAGDEGESHSFVLPTDAQVCCGLCVALRQAKLPVPTELAQYAKKAAAERREDMRALSAPPKKKAKKEIKETRNDDESDVEDNDESDAEND